ncbi:MAG: hypothetical protein R3C14_36520 [Caldilineaceae bacterium]
MQPPQQDLRVIVIGGPSNAGKSTLAQSLAQTLGWVYRATDGLGRYPGRPWITQEGPFPPHLVEHYSSLSVEELFEGVRNHYMSMWPKIKALITDHATDCSLEPLVLEGSAIWPETVMTLELEQVAAIWLAPSDQLLQNRIHQASRFAEASARDQAIIQKFVGRALLYNQSMRDAVKRFGLATLAVAETATVEELTTRCLELIHHGDARIGVRGVE